MNTPTVESPPLKATRREWIGLGVLALPTLLLSLDVSVLYLALPHLSAGLGADSTEQLWILDIYSFLLAGFLVTMGTLGDRVGRRRLLLIGAAAFGVVSVVAAYSTSPEMLILSRAALGVAGASLMPSTMALIRNMFTDPKQMGVAIGVWFACFMGGMMLGPLVGGLLLEHFWWGSAFLLGVPFMVVLLVVGPIFLPEYRDAAAGRLDLVSVALSLGAILPVIYGLKEVARDGADAGSLAIVLTGLVVGAVFVRRQRHLANPLLDLRLFANRAFSTSLGLMLLGGVVMAGISLMSSLYLQLVQGMSPIEAGLWLVPQNLALILGFMAAPALAQRVRPAFLIAGGMVIAAAGLLAHTRVDSVGGLDLVVTGLVLASFGIAFPMSLGTGFMLGAAPPEKAGSAAAMSETSGEFGIAVGIAALGSLGTVVYRSRMDGDVTAALPAEATAAARESIAAAINTAADLPASVGVDLIEVARSSFTSGFNVVGAVGAAIFAGLAVLAAVVLRREGVTSEASDAAAD